MRKELAKGFAKLGLLVVMIMIAAGTSAKAQSLEYKLTANIPFDFTVADKKFEAGKYLVGRAQPLSGDTVVRISSVGGHENINRFTIPVIRLTSENKGKLVFHRYGDEYFLFQIWPAGSTTGRAFAKSRSERDVVRKAHDNVVGMAMMKAPEIVTIVADLP
jgi:hypothetical protein